MSRRSLLALSMLAACRCQRCLPLEPSMRARTPRNTLADGVVAVDDVAAASRDVRYERRALLATLVHCAFGAREPCCLRWRRRCLLTAPAAIGVNASQSVWPGASSVGRLREPMQRPHSEAPNQAADIAGKRQNAPRLPEPRPEPT